MSFLLFTNTRLEALKCFARGHFHEKPREPRTRGLRVKHFTTEPRKTLYKTEALCVGKKTRAAWIRVVLTELLYKPVKCEEKSNP